MVWCTSPVLATISVTVLCCGKRQVPTRSGKFGQLGSILKLISVMIRTHTSPIIVVPIVVPIVDARCPVSMASPSPVSSYAVTALAILQLLHAFFTAVLTVLDLAIIHITVLYGFLTRTAD